MVIPPIDGVILAGQTFGVAKNDAILGPAVVSYLAGLQAKADGKKFTPETPDQAAVREAALMLIEAFPNLDVRKKKK